MVKNKIKLFNKSHNEHFFSTTLKFQRKFVSVFADFTVFPRISYFFFFFFA